MRANARTLSVAAALITLCAMWTPVAWAQGQPIDPLSAAYEAFESTVADARANMMADPAQALAQAQTAETLTQDWFASDTQNRAHATALWLQAEALVRLNRARDAESIAARGLDLVSSSGAASKLEADLLTAIGRIAKQTGDYGRALASSQRAHDIYLELGETRSQAISLQSIGYIYFAAGQYDRVVEYFEDASRLYPEDDALSLSALNNVANALKQLEQYDEALVSYQRSLELAIRMDSPMLRARILNNIASLHVLTDDLDAADAAIEQALAIAEAMEMPDWLRFLRGVQAQSAYAKGDLERARRYIEDTFDGAPLEQTTQNFRDFHQAAFEIYGALGEWRLAAAHLVAFKRLDDEGRDIAASANTALLNAQFDFAHQELKIEQLNRERLEQDIELARAAARQRLIIAIGVVVALFVLTIAAMARARVMQRARDIERESNAKLTSINTQLSEAKAALVSALARANAAADAKAAFLSTMSHELRTPLNAIIGFAEAIRRQLQAPDGSTDYAEFADRIRDGGQEMLGIVKSVLEIASLDVEETRARSAEVPIIDVVDDAVVAQTSLARSREVRVSVEDGGGNVRVDEDSVRRAVEAVLKNALMFSPRGQEVRVVIQPDADQLHITIVDDGPGMSADMLDRAFKPFEKGDASTTSEHAGVGLGLTLAKAIAEANGGSLTLCSEQGHGTSATFTFPRAIEREDILRAA